jgi:alkylhydroperoxidase family enzyme
VSWIDETPAGTPLEAVLGQRPELLERYRAFYQTFWEDGLVPRRTLELCRLRIAAIHDCDQEWIIRDAQIALSDVELDALKAGEFSTFSVAEQVALNVAEQIPYQHHQVSDEQISDVDRELKASGAVSLLTACAFFDVTCRLRIVLGVEARPAELEQPPLQRGALV